MEQVKVNGIVLSNMDYKEKDKIATLFTLEQGIISVLFKGVKNSNAKLKSAKEIFTFGEYIYVDGQFKTVSSAEIIDSFYDLTKDIKKYYCGCAILGIIKDALPREIARELLFLDTLKILRLLTYENLDTHMIINKFLTIVFEMLGYKFSLNCCNSCGEKFLSNRYFNFQHGDITCHNCRNINSVQISPELFNALRLTAVTPVEKLSTLKIKKDIQEKLFELLNNNYKYRFNTELNINF